MTDDDSSSVADATDCTLADASSEAAATVPDELAKTFTKQPMRIKPVDDSLVLKDDAMEVDLYHVTNNSHADTLLR